MKPAKVSTNFVINTASMSYYGRAFMLERTKVDKEPLAEGNSCHGARTTACHFS